MTRCYKLFLLMPLLLLNSCSTTTEPDEIAIFGTPVINGIILTAWDSPDEIGKWRNPQYPGLTETNGGIPLDYSMNNPFPNPATDAVVISYALPISAEVSIWIVKGRLPEEIPHPAETGAGGVFVSGNNNPAVVIFSERRLAAGFYQVVFDGKIGKDYIPAGFYRIYLKVDKHLFWRDILVARSKADLPPELRDRYFNNN